VIGLINIYTYGYFMQVLILKGLIFRQNCAKMRAFSPDCGAGAEPN